MKSGETRKKWFIRYYDAAGKQQRYTIGEYTALGLADARLKALQLTEQFKQGQTLAEQAKQKKSGTTFADLTSEWLEKKKEGWVEAHAIRQKERLGAVLRVFGDKDVNQVDMDDVTAAINYKIRQGAIETALRTISLIRQVFEFADTMGRLEDNRYPAPRKASLPGIVGNADRRAAGQDRDVNRAASARDRNRAEIGILSDCQGK